METEKFLKELKGIYEEKEPSIQTKLYGWERLLPKLEHREKPVIGFFFRLSFALVLVLILASKTSLPGNPLYPVKILSEQVINSATGNNQASIDNRAEEIVQLVEKDKNNEEELKQTIENYSQSVSEAPLKNERYKKKLQKHHGEFERTAQESPEHESELKKAIQASETQRNDSEENEPDRENRSNED